MRRAALPDVAAWAQPGRTWAPAVVRTRTGYLLYYTVRHRDWGHQCISVAHAASPTGPYLDTSVEPLVCHTDNGGSIDPTAFQDHDGSLYLTWKSEGETVGQQAIIWSARLNGAGDTITGPSIPLITADRRWEGRVVEAPTMQRIGSAWVLLFRQHLEHRPLRHRIRTVPRSAWSV